MRLGGVLVAIALAAACGKVESDLDAGAGVGGVPIPSGGGSANAPGGGGSANAPGGGVGNLGGYSTGGFGSAGEWERLGRACATDAECGSVTKCVLAASDAFGGEGPAKGYCSVSCTDDSGICKQFQHTGAATIVCKKFSNGEAYCLEGCWQGPDGLTQFDPNKCHGRQEVACTPIFVVDGGYIGSACFPQCNSNADCGSALACNPKTGLCTAMLPPGLPLGESCAASGPCQGVCQTIESSAGTVITSVCSSRCTLGAIPSCGWEGPGTGPAPAACLYPAPGVAANGGPGIGDLGYCGKLCDCAGDCAPSLACVPWPGPDAPQLEEFFQRTGYCGDPAGVVDAGTQVCVVDGG